MIKASGTITLNENDWGMVILLLYEAQSILNKNERRFRGELQSLREDLAEIAGERGPVSVKQQLQIVKRMSRTYAFLKDTNSDDGFIL